MFVQGNIVSVGGGGSFLSLLGSYDYGAMLVSLFYLCYRSIAVDVYAVEDDGPIFLVDELYIGVFSSILLSN